MSVLGALMLAYVFVKPAIDLSVPGQRSILEIGSPLAIAIFFGTLRAVLTFVQRTAEPRFFKRKPCVAEPGSLEATTLQR